MIADYIEAFQRCYPHKTVEVRTVYPKKRGDEFKYSVVINGDRGDILLTESDMRSASRSFNRGKVL